MENKIRVRSLERSLEFQKLRANGQSFHINSWLLVNVQKTNMDELRLGWTIPRQVGTAVVRNRLRRWGREYLRRWSETAGKSLDINLIFKRQEKGFYRLLNHKEFDEAFKKLSHKLERHLR